jgi:cytochrome c oxidase cbb3-type subunit 2
MLVSLMQRAGAAACVTSFALCIAGAASAQAPNAEAPGATGTDAAQNVPERALALATDDTPPSEAVGANTALQAAPPASQERPAEIAAEPAAAPPAHLDATTLAIADQRGRSVYRRRCAACHGLLGDGRGAAARFLEVAPRDFTTGVYKWRTTGSGELPTDADLLRTVRRGVPGTAMPGWDGLVPIRDMWAAVQYIKTLSPRFREEQPVAPLDLPASVPQLDAAARRRGRLVYVLLQCWTCHGITGQGDGPAAATLRDDNQQPIVAYDFTRGQMRGGTRPIDIYRTFATGVNGTPMPSYDEALLVGRNGYADLGRYRAVLTAEGLRELEAFLRNMPTTEALWAMPAATRTAWGNRMRWDLVAYVLSLSNTSTLWRYLWAAPYVTR